MEIVIVPTWNRPDFLTACLRRLLLADEPGLIYWICVDRGFSSSHQLLARAVDGFTSRLSPRARVFTRQHPYRGNSFNVLTAYRDALLEAPDLVHLVEDDVFVARDYFDFHRRAHDLCPDAFAVSACRNQQYPLGIDPPQDERAVWLHHDYQSIGVSFRPAVLEKVVPHGVSAYFTDPIGYCRQHWPATRIHPGHAEQDGLIHRVIEAAGAKVAYPAVPRAYHAGFYGRNRRGNRVYHVGTMEERADRLLAMTAAELNAAATSYRDHSTTPLDADRAPVDRVIAWPVGD